MARFRTPGRLILDTNCLGQLETGPGRDRFDANLIAADWEVWPTLINLLEILKHKNESVRRRLLSTLSSLTNGRPLLPWPHLLLKQVGAAVANGQNRFSLDPTGLDWVLAHPDGVRSQLLDNAQRLLKDQESGFAQMLLFGRRRVRKELKRLGLQNQWKSARAFIDEQWSTEAHLTPYVTGIWDRLGIEGTAPIQQILRTEVWRLYFDGQGIGVFERCISERPPKPVHQIDLLQLMYLGESHRRMFASADVPLLRAAHAVLDQRYPRSRVIHISELTK